MPFTSRRGLRAALLALVAALIFAPGVLEQPAKPVLASGGSIYQYCTVGSSGATTLTCTFAQRPNDGDVLMASVNLFNTEAVTITPPSAWPSPVATAFTGGGRGTALYVHTVLSTDGSSFVWTFTDATHTPAPN